MVSQVLTRLRGDAATVVFWRLIGIASNVLLTLILTHGLKVDGHFRDYSVFVSILSFGTIFAAFGQNEAALRFIAEQLALGQQEQAHRFWQSAKRIALFSALVTASVICLRLLFDDWELSRSISPSILYITMFAGIVLLAWQMVAAESLRGYQEVRLASLFSGGLTGGPISSLLLVLTAGLLYVTNTLTLERVLITYVLAIAITLPFPLLLLRRLSQLSPRAQAEVNPTSSTTKTLLSVGIVLMLIQLLGFALQATDVLIGGKIIRQEQVAEMDHYIAAKRIVLLIAMPVQMAMLTIISSIPNLFAQRKLSELQNMLQGTAFIAAVPALAASLPLLFFPEWTLGVILPERYMLAAPYLQVLVAGYLVLVLTGNPQHVLTMTGHHKVAVIVNLISFALLLGLGCGLTYHYGAMGLAIAASASLSVQNLLLWILARQLVGVWTHVGLPTFSRQTT